MLKKQLPVFKQRSSVFGVTIFIFFILVSVISLNVVKGKILDNSQTMGREIASQFALKETTRLKMQTILLQSAAKSMERLLARPYTDVEAADFLQAAEQYLRGGLNSEHFRLCAVADGKVFGAADLARPGQMQWYKQALAGRGQIVYVDGGAAQSAFIMAVRTGENAALALATYPQKDRGLLADNLLPEDSNYYLCDASGHLLYAINGREHDLKRLQPYVDRIIGEIAAGRHDDSNSFVYDLDGNKRGVYYSKTANGWLSIVTIPDEFLLKDYENLLYWYIITMLIFMSFVCLVYWREKRLNRQVELTSEAVRVLGDSYYAIYRINFHNGSYLSMKSSDYVGSRVGASGAYDSLLKVMLEVVEPDAAAEFAQSFSLENMRKLVEKRVHDFGGDFHQKFGDEYKWVNVRLLFDDSLDLGEAILCFKEVDAEKRQQLEHMKLTEDALKTIQENAASKNMFYSSMSHDMRTPLNGIIGLSELAEKYVDEPEKVRDYLGKINASSKQLLGLINDILEMSKLEHGRLETAEEVFNLQTSLEECVNLFEVQAKMENKTFTVRYELEDFCVSGDFPRIRQILNNVLSNAFKYTPEQGEISLTVRQLTVQETAKYQFTVRDNGYGMTEDFLKKIFIPFERDTRFGAKNIKGTGLGMAIVKSLLARMNGDIHIESAIGKGTCMTITLPLKVKRDGSCALRSAVNEAAPQKDVLKGRTVLIAEDNEINMEIAAELLQLAGMKVLQAINGREAVEKFAASSLGGIDIILLDMQMPELNGCEAARAIRTLQRDDAKTTPIIAVTANAFAEDIAATTAAGMDGHISKPIDFKGLQNVMSKLLTKADERKQKK